MDCRAALKGVFGIWILANSKNPGITEVAAFKRELFFRSGIFIAILSVFRQTAKRVTSQTEPRLFG